MLDFKVPKHKIVLGTILAILAFVGLLGFTTQVIRAHTQGSDTTKYAFGKEVLAHETYRSLVELSVGQEHLVVKGCSSASIDLLVTADTVIILTEPTKELPAVYLVGKPSGLTNNNHTLLVASPTGDFALTKITIHKDSVGGGNKFMLFNKTKDSNLFILSPIPDCKKAQEIVEKNLN